MTIWHLIDILQTMNADADVVVALFSADGTSETFAIEDVTNTNGNAQGCRKRTPRLIGFPFTSPPPQGTFR